MVSNPGIINDQYDFFMTKCPGLDATDQAPVCVKTANFVPCD